MRYNQANTAGDSERTEALIRIPEWVLPHETHDALFAVGYGTALDLSYARGVPDTPLPDPSTFNRRKCNLILVEVGFCRDFGCHTMHQEETAKYALLVTALKAVWEKAELVTVPIGHAGKTLTTTQRHLAQSLSVTRPEIEQSRAK